MTIITLKEIMMEFQNVLESRRSIRKYDETKKVAKEQIDELIRAAIYAPTWKNSQTARYYAAVTEEGIAKVRACLPEFNANNTAGAAYIVTAFVANRSGYERDGAPSTELDHNEWGVYDLGLASENLLLKAADMRLGTLVMGIRDAAALKAALEIPEDQKIVSVIAVGYAAVEAVMPKRKEVEDVAKFF